MIGKIIKRERISKDNCKKKAPICFRYVIQNKNETAILPSIHFFPVGKNIEYNKSKILSSPKT